MNTIETILYSELKKTVVKSAVSHLVGKTVGIKAYIVTKLVEVISDKILLPSYLLILRKGKVAYDKRQIRISIEGLIDAKTESEFNTAVDNLK